MTCKENAYEVINRSGKARWVPILGEDVAFVSMSADYDRPQNGEDGYDWFGCYWVYDAAIRGYAQPPSKALPISDICLWRDQLKLPNLDEIDWAGSAKRDLENIDWGNKLLLIKTESGCFERLHQLVGFEDAFIAMYEEPDAFHELMDALADFRIRYYEKIAEYYNPDIVFVMDDLGSSNGPLFSLDMYRDFIKPYDSRIIAAIKAMGTRVCYHSCGCMQDFVADIIDMGADTINPLQGGINDQTTIQERFGDCIGFIGGLDNLVHLDYTTEEELRAEVRRVMELFAGKKNFILSTNSYVPGYSAILLDEAHKYNQKLMEMST